jgi:nitrate/nitrite transporter NarK
MSGEQRMDGKPKALQGGSGLAVAPQLLAALLRNAWRDLADRFGGRITMFQGFETYGAVTIAV